MSGVRKSAKRKIKKAIKKKTFQNRKKNGGTLKNHFMTTLEPFARCLFWFQFEWENPAA